MKYFRLELDDQLHTQIKLSAVKVGGSMHDLIVKAIEEYLKKLEGDDQK